jgi:cytochrome b561/polyisoprenoid-binding protein YceI
MLGTAGERYSRVAMLLHWIIAGALAVEIGIGFGMPKDISGFAIVQFHKSLGITILVLTVLRIVWRLGHKPPPAVDKGPLGLLAKLVHVGLYVFMLAAPLTGWMLVSTDELKVPTVIFGLIPLPHLPLAPSINEGVGEVHELLAFFGIALFLLHVAGALKHHFINRDTVLSRMSPGGSAMAGIALLAAVLVAHFGTIMVLPGHEEGEEAGEAPAALPTADEAVTANVADAPVEEEVLAGEEEASEEEAAAADAGPPPAWSIQPGGSLRFAADNGGSAISGSFRRWSGSITMNPDDPAGSRIAIEIDLASASLGDATQDQMLAGSEFFAVAANPVATRWSTSTPPATMTATRRSMTASPRKPGSGST